MSLGIKKGYLVFSNSVEVLFEHLKANLFSEVRTEDVFTERIIVVPSQGLRDWIHMRIASSVGISCGLTTTYLDKGIELIRQRFFFFTEELFIPTRNTLFLRLNQEIERILDLPGDTPIWQPLIKYLQGKQQRKINLCKHLAQLFERYGVYANQAAALWEKKPSDWQQALWMRVFNEWSYPQRAQQLLKIKKNHSKDKLSIHFFAFSHFSPLHFQFLNKVQDMASVFLYQLSPCQEFWSDLSKEHPSLLAALGKVGREMARQIEESEIPTEEAYIVFNTNTQLKQLQHDLLTMQMSCQILEDDSIQVHQCVTPHGEIEQLYSLLHTLFSKMSVEPKDVIVMAPQIGVYTPYIQSVFDTIPYRIADMPVQISNQIVDGFLMLLELEEKRWNAPFVLALFENPLFLAKQKWTEDDLTCIRRWIQKTQIKWGIDQDHRAALLKKGHCIHTVNESNATWMEGLGYLLEELALPNDQPRIHFTQAELLGQLITVIQSLYGDLKELNIPKTIHEWIVFFKKLTATYLVDESDASILISMWDSIESAANPFSEQKYNFAVIDSMQRDWLDAQSITLHRNLCQAVHFCSMLPMRAIPAKVICLIGMNHDAFPRKEQLQSLDLLQQYKECDYSPSRLDFDRYLFLEAILSAREKLIISYLAIDPLDQTPLPPSSVVSQILPYVCPKQVIAHPAHKLDDVRIEPFMPFAIRVKDTFHLPQGHFVIETNDLSRLVRSGLRHYLHWHELKIHEQETIEADEPFILSPLNKSRIRRKAILGETVLEAYERENAFPLGMLGQLARKQAQQEIAFLSDAEMKKKKLNPIQIQINPSLTITFRGVLDGVHATGMCVADKHDIKGCVKAWPLFLLLNAQDPSKKILSFAGTKTEKESFFDDPVPYLHSLVEYFFYAQKHLCPLIPDWIEPIFKNDPKKMARITVYDTALKWQLIGRRPLDYASCVSIWRPWVEKLYGSMIHAWF